MARSTSITSFVTFDRTVLGKRQFAHYNFEPIKRAGAYVRKVAVNSIRKSKPNKAGVRVPSRAGKPPRSWSAAHSMRLILFDTKGRLDNEVIVGPVGFGGPRPVTQLHEFGGSRRGTSVPILAKSRAHAIQQFKRRRGGYHNSSINRKGNRWRKKTSRAVSEIDTPDKIPRGLSSKERQSLHIKMWYGDQASKGKITVRNYKITGAFKYPERPYMRPALNKAMDKVPELWKSSITGPGARLASRSRMSNFSMSMMGN